MSAEGQQDEAQPFTGDDISKDERAVLDRDCVEAVLKDLRAAKSLLWDAICKIERNLK